MGAEIKEIHSYCKGDAPEVRVAYLQGVILQDNKFITEGRCFFIKNDDEVTDQSVSINDLFVE